MQRMTAQKNTYKKIYQNKRYSPPRLSSSPFSLLHVPFYTFPVYRIGVARGGPDGPTPPPANEKKYQS